MSILVWWMETFSVKHIMVKIIIIKLGATVLAQSSHLTEEETKAQRGWLTSSKSPQWVENPSGQETSVSPQQGNRTVAEREMKLMRGLQLLVLSKYHSLIEICTYFLLLL